MGGNGEMCTCRSCACLLFFSHSMLIQGLGVSLFIFSLVNHAAGVPTMITHSGIQSKVIEKLFFLLRTFMMITPIYAERSTGTEKKTIQKCFF